MSLNIAIIGRPNVGKSTLFNRLVGKKLALVDDLPGVTRDRRQGAARLGDLEFSLCDTAGLEEAPIKALAGRMQAQTRIAIAEADLCLFVIDARDGIIAEDEKFADLLRAKARAIILVANKAEGVCLDGLYEAYGLGLGEPVPVSAEHGEGMGALYEAIRPYADHYADDHADKAARSGTETDNLDDPLKPLRIAIVGRPNAGKSTLINHMIGDERLLTGPEAGITRDSVSVDWAWQDGSRSWPVRLFDTAGMRKRAKISRKLEKLSVSDGIRAVKFAEIVVVLFDATIAFEKQDLAIADLALREGRAIVLAANKWDLIDEPDAAFDALRRGIARAIPQAPDVPVVAISALTGWGVADLMPRIIRVYQDWNARVKTGDLNNWLGEALTRHPPPLVKGRRLKFRYIAQIKTRPPTFVVQCARAGDVPESYRRYLIKGIRKAFDIPAVPIRLILNKQQNPFAKEKRP